MSLGLKVLHRFAATVDWKVIRRGGRATIELHQGGEKIGFLSIGTEDPRFMDDGDCKSNVLALLTETSASVKVYRVLETELDPEYRGKGYGVEMYDRLLKEVRPAILTTDRCHGGETSPDAQRVWSSLAKRHRLLGQGPDDWALLIK